MEWHWETQKKIWEKRVGKEQVVQPNGTSWHKLEHVEQVEQGEAGLQIYVEQVEQEQGGLEIDVEQVEQGQGVCPAEPLHLCQSGSTRPWNFVQFSTLEGVLNKFDFFLRLDVLSFVLLRLDVSANSSWNQFVWRP